METGEILAIEIPAAITIIIVFGFRYLRDWKNNNQEWEAKKYLKEKELELQKARLSHEKKDQKRK